jgi:hypothetical protein
MNLLRKTIANANPAAIELQVVAVILERSGSPRHRYRSKTRQEAHAPA